MERLSLILHAVSLTTVVVLGGVVWNQSQRIDLLESSSGAEMEQRERRVERGVRKNLDSRSSRNEIKKTKDVLVGDSPRPKTRRFDHLNVDREDPVADSPIESEDEMAATVRNAVVEEIETREQQRWQKRLDRRIERTKTRVAEFASSAGVAEATKLRIEDLLVTEQTEISSLFQEARENMSFGEAREKAMEVRKETDETARAELDDDEYTEYEKMREEELAAFRGPRRPRPDDGKKPKPKPE